MRRLAADQRSEKRRKRPLAHGCPRASRAWLSAQPASQPQLQSPARQTPGGSWSFSWHQHDRVVLSDEHLVELNQWRNVRVIGNVALENFCVRLERCEKILG